MYRRRVWARFLRATLTLSHSLSLRSLSHFRVWLDWEQNQAWWGRLEASRRMPVRVPNKEVLCEHHLRSKSEEAR